MASNKTFGVMSNFTAILLDLSTLYLSMALSTKVNCGVGAASLVELMILDFTVAIISKAGNFACRVFSASLDFFFFSAVRSAAKMKYSLHSCYSTGAPAATVSQLAHYLL